MQCGVHLPGQPARRSVDTAQNALVGCLADEVITEIYDRVSAWSSAHYLADEIARPVRNSATSTSRRYARVFSSLTKSTAPCAYHQRAGLEIAWVVLCIPASLLWAVGCAMRMATRREDHVRMPHYGSADELELCSLLFTLPTASLPQMAERG